MDYEKIEGWACNWLKGVEDIKTQMESSIDPELQKKLARMLPEAENIMRAIIGQDKGKYCLRCGCVEAQFTKDCKECNSKLHART